MKQFTPPIDLARNLISQQFPEFAHLTVQPVKTQGHDNRTFRLGQELLVRLPTAEAYALKVSIEHQLLPKLQPYLSVDIPTPLKMGVPSELYPFHFSIYKWLNGESLNHLTINEIHLDNLAAELANFLNELQRIDTTDGPTPGLHNYWRGAHIHVYSDQALQQITSLADTIDIKKAHALWEAALRTKWHNPPVWIHGDMAIGNILMQNNTLSGVIDFGGLAIGDPACDLVIAWTLFTGKSRKIFQSCLNMDDDTWIRAKAWALWKSTYELCNIKDTSSSAAKKHLHIIAELFLE